MATTTRSLTVPGDGTATHPCPCGCASCEGTCCNLDCLVQPRFFCGQLLTDRDLTTLVGWARDKFGLSRYREGWGVVCGLDVHCASDSKHPLRVAVSPGYALGCCGDDIIVCEAATLDLSDACREEADPCADLRKQLKGRNAIAGSTRRSAPGTAATGSISGKVVDPIGAIVPGWMVRIVNKATGVEQSTTTDINGRFSVNLPVGTYRLTVLLGVYVLVADNVVVRPNEETMVTVRSEGGIEPPDDEDLYRVVDIYLRYAEQPSEPATAMGRSACKEVAECEYSRTQESYALSWQFGQLSDDPVQAAAMRWHKGYEQCLEVLKKFNEKFPFTQSPRGEDVRRWLMEWMERHPLRHFCHLRDEICTASADDLIDQEKLVKWLFGFVQDCRNAYLNCACAGCESDPGVPLARVWLKSKDEHWGRENCHILRVDPYPPFRRPLKQDCWPAPLGSVNVGRAIWHRRQEACTMLADLGVRLSGEQEFTLPNTPAELEEKLSCDLFVPCGEERAMLYYRLGPYDERVVGFCADTAPPQPVPNMEAFKEGPPRARLNEQVNYRVNVRNTGNVELTVRVEENGVAVGGGARVLPVGQSADFTYNQIIPDNAVGTFTNRAAVTGETVSSERITRDVEHTLTIDSGPPPLPAAISVDMQCSHNQANVGEEVTYFYVVRNEGDVDLQPVEISCDFASPNPTTIPSLPARQTHPTLSSSPFRVPSNVGDMLTNNVRAVGVPPSGPNVVGTDFHTMSITFPNLSNTRLTEHPTDVSPATPADARSSDDFTAISGIGESRAAALSEAGINTYAGLAESSVEQLRELFPGVSEGTLKQWIKDAKKLAQS